MYPFAEYPKRALESLCDRRIVVASYLHYRPRLLVHGGRGVRQDVPAVADDRKKALSQRQFILGSSRRLAVKATAVADDEAFRSMHHTRNRPRHFGRLDEWIFDDVDGLTGQESNHEGCIRLVREAEG